MVFNRLIFFITCLTFLPFFLYSQKKVSFALKDYSYRETAIYSKITEMIDNNNVLKKDLKYIDNIDTYLLKYNSRGSEIDGFLVKPKAEGKYPCIIFNRGGIGKKGDINMEDALFKLGIIAAHGYVVIASRYRDKSANNDTDEFGGKDVDDVLNLIPVLSELEYADTSRIGMFGMSRGGMMTYLALARTEKIKAAVTVSGMTDLIYQLRNDTSFENYYLRYIPGYCDNTKNRLLKKRSAVYWSDKICKTTPLLLIHCGEDTVVDMKQTMMLAERLKDTGHPFRLLLFEDGGHGGNGQINEMMFNVLAWFDLYLRQKKPVFDIFPDF